MSYWKEYRKNNLEKVREYEKKRNMLFRLQKNNHVRLYYKINREEFRRVKNAKRTRRKREELLEFLAGKPPQCKKCGISDTRVLQIDHINDDGFIDRQKFQSSSSQMWYWINNPIEAKKRIQVLCSNCHAIKSWHKDEF